MWVCSLRVKRGTGRAFSLTLAYCFIQTSEVEEQLNKRLHARANQASNLYMLSSGGRLVCPTSCLVLSYLRLLPVCCLSLNAVSPGFLRNFFMCQITPPGALLLRLTDLNSIEVEIDMRKLLFLGRLVTEHRQ